ncbi:hypothetical protein AK812_SmicGene26731 [Symbiodinium microadriaticum]|uniref:Uncharacterized protein n=1 Tax=Symbiodinium microadriaticum TaxID=2951 RepID=A0A1Q9D8S6_SYMMI|nr:hypothetical protein AK812_SmicGene26731 [Symbiodinium microadriaticum]
MTCKPGKHSVQSGALSSVPSRKLPQARSYEQSPNKFPGLHSLQNPQDLQGHCKRGVFQSTTESHVGSIKFSAVLSTSAVLLITAMKQSSWLLFVAASWWGGAPSTAVKFAGDGPPTQRRKTWTRWSLQSSSTTSLIASAIHECPQIRWGAVGSAAANAAMVVADHVIEAATTKLDTLRSLHADIAAAADRIGDDALDMGREFQDVGQSIVEGVVDLSQNALDHLRPARPTHRLASHVQQSWDAGMSAGMGERFIEPGNFRCGAIDDNHSSIAHCSCRQLGNSYYDPGLVRSTEGIWNAAGQHFHGPRGDFTSWHQQLAPSKDISFGYQFIPLGKFQLGAFDDSHLSVSHKNSFTIDIFRRHGLIDRTRRSDFGTLDRPVERALGVRTQRSPLDPAVRNSDPGGIDASSWDGPTVYTAEILTGDDKVHPGPRDGELARGSLRLGHLSISHKDGQTAKLFQWSVGYVWSFNYGPMTPFNAWTRKVGPPSGITFGDRFLQIGDFCAGDADGSHLSVSYFPWRSWAGKGGVYRYSTDFPPGLTAALDIGNAYGYLLNDRYANWRCGSIQEVIGSCAGFVTGEDFVQIGDWRLSADDANTKYWPDMHGKSTVHSWQESQVARHRAWIREAKAPEDYTTLGRPMEQCQGDGWCTMPQARRCRLGKRINGWLCAFFTRRRAALVDTNLRK